MKIKLVLMILVLAFLRVLPLCAQENIDSLFHVAIEQARTKSYDMALSTAQRVAESDPERADVYVFMANVNAWKGQYQVSRSLINRAYSLDSNSKELYDAWLNILLWSSEYRELLEKVSIARDHNYPDERNLLLKEMVAHKELKEYAKGVALLSEGDNKKFLEYPPIKHLYRELVQMSRKQEMTAFYSLDLFEDNTPDAQHLFFVDYGFKIKQDRLILRANYASRFGNQGVQFESDYYHIMSKGRYLYLNYGYGLKSELFPKHRVGAEYYFPIKSSYEASLGGRYLDFANSSVVIATGHMARYWNSFWFSVRPFYAFNEQRNSFTTIANIRKYGKKHKSYWGLELGYGNSPDERFILNQTPDYLRLDSYRFKVEKNIVIGNIPQIKLAAGYAYEEIGYSNFRNRYILEITFKY